MRVFLTGATGFLGRRVLAELLSSGHTPRCLIQRDEPDDLIDVLPDPIGDRPRVEFVTGDLFADNGVPEDAATGCDAVIHLVGPLRPQPRRNRGFARMIIGGTEAVLGAARRGGVARVIHVSAIGAMPESTSEFHRAKGQAEISVQSSGTAWTIVRPSLLLGTGGIDLDRCFLPLTGGHLAPRTRSVSHRFQPIGVEDVAHGLVNALERSQTEGLACEAGGVDVLTLGEMLELRGAARGLSVRFVRVPPSVTRISGLGKTLPKLQTLMRARARCDDPEPFWLAFGVTPKPASVLLREIESASELRGD